MELRGLHTVGAPSRRRVAPRSEARRASQATLTTLHPIRPQLKLGLKVWPITKQKATNEHSKQTYNTHNSKLPRTETEQMKNITTHCKTYKNKRMQAFLLNVSHQKTSNMQPCVPPTRGTNGCKNSVRGSTQQYI
jgi:hypothetical protein